MSKFNKGDMVRIKENRLQPNTVGKVGIVTNIYSDADTNESLYRIRLNGRKTTLRGVAEEYCLEAVNNVNEE